MLQAGAVVGYQSDTRGLVRAVVLRGPHPDGTWDLDIKPHVPLNRIVPPADGRPQSGQAQGPNASFAPPQSGLSLGRSPGGAAPSTAMSMQNSAPPTAMSMGGAPMSAARMQDYGRNKAPRPAGTICFYKSATRGWIPARVQRANNDGTYDLDCKERAFQEAIFWIDEGALVEYYSSSQNRWVPCRVVRQGRQEGTFDLDCREAAEVQRMRPCNKSVEEPSTFEVVPGMAAYQAPQAPQETTPEVPKQVRTEGRDKDMVYEDHKVGIRLRPRSSSRDVRPRSVDELHIEDQVRHQLNEAISSSNKQQLQAAIKNANSKGHTTGIELSNAMKALHSLGGKLERTNSADVMKMSSDEYDAAFAGKPAERGRPRSRERPQSVQFGEVGTDPQIHEAPGQSQAPQRSVYEDAMAETVSMGQMGPGYDDNPHSIYEDGQRGFLTRMVGPKPTEDAGLLTRMFGAKPTEDAGLLTRVLGAKPRQEASILERIFGEADDDRGDPHYDQREQQHPQDMMATAYDSHVGPGPSNMMATAYGGPPGSRSQMSAYGAGAPPTDPQLHHLNPQNPRPGPGYGQPAYGHPGYETPPNTQQNARPSPAPYGGMGGIPEYGGMGGGAPPTDPQMHSHQGYGGHPAPHEPYGNGRQPPYGNSSCMDTAYHNNFAPGTDPQMGGPRSRFS